MNDAEDIAGRPSQPHQGVATRLARHAGGLARAAMSGIVRLRPNRATAPQAPGTATQPPKPETTTTSRPGRIAGWLPRRRRRTAPLPGWDMDSDAPFTPERCPGLSQEICDLLNTPAQDLRPDILHLLMLALAEYLAHELGLGPEGAKALFGTIQQRLAVPQDTPPAPPEEAPPEEAQEAPPQAASPATQPDSTAAQPQAEPQDAPRAQPEEAPPEEAQEAPSQAAPPATEPHGTAAQPQTESQNAPRAQPEEAPPQPALPATESRAAAAQPKAESGPAPEPRSPKRARRDRPSRRNRHQPRRRPPARSTGTRSPKHAPLPNRRRHCASTGPP